MCPLLTIAVVASSSSYATWRFLHWIVGAGWYSIPSDPPIPPTERDATDRRN